MKKKQRSANIQVEPVKLKPVLGLHPGVYVTVIVVLCVAVVLFIVGFLPGILNGGKRVTFTSSSEPMAVTVDGRYLGKAPVTAFIESGNHTVEFNYIGEFGESFDFSVSHPVFFTWLFPRRQTVASAYTPSSNSEVRAVLSHMLNEVSAWSAIIDFNETYHYPPLMREAAATLAVSKLDDEGRMLIEQYLDASLRYITGKVMLDDAREALETLRSHAMLSADASRDFEQKLVSISMLFDEESKSIGLASKALADPAVSDQLNADRFSIDAFRYQGGSFVLGDTAYDDFPSVVRMGIQAETKAFSISQQEISEYQWALFLEERPFWAKENIDRLIEEGLVDDNYLAGIYPSSVIVSNKPIRNISYHAANAFCEWLTQISGVQVSLPTEKQWEYAALNLQNPSYASSLSGLPDKTQPSAMFGSVWELSATPFVPLGRYLGETENLLTRPLSYVVKGGSYLNDPNFTTAAVVGVQDGTTCSETTGFRIVWTR